MDIPALFQTLQTIALFSETLLIVWLVLLLVALQVSDRGAVLLPSTLAIYFLLGIAVSTVALPHIALIVWVFGTFTVLILYLSLRSLSERRDSGLVMQERGYRLLIGLALGIIAALIGYFSEIPSGSAEVAALIWPLLILGVLRFGVAKRGMEMGVGLLMILAGIGLWLTAINDSPIIPGVWAAGSIFLALATGWLTDRTEGRIVSDLPQQTA